MREAFVMEFARWHFQPLFPFPTTALRDRAWVLTFFTVTIRTKQFLGSGIMTNEWHCDRYCNSSGVIVRVSILRSLLTTTVVATTLHYRHMEKMYKPYESL